jgi:hypothetical protein
MNPDEDVRDLTRDTLDNLFSYVESDEKRSLLNLFPRASTVGGVDMLLSNFLIQLQWLSEACARLSVAQVEFLMEVCKTLTYGLSTAPFCDFTVYNTSSPMYRVIWFQTRRCIGLYDRFFGFGHLFSRNVFWTLTCADLIRQVDVLNRLALDRMMYYGIEIVQAKYAVIKRAFQLQEHWYRLTNYDHLRTICMTDIDLILPHVDGPSPGHPDRKAALWTHYGHSLNRYTLPTHIISRTSLLRYANILAVLLTRCCSGMGFQLAYYFTDLFPRFRIIFYDGVVAVEDAITLYIHFIPFGVFFERGFDIVRAVQSLIYLDPACQNRNPFREWLQTADRTYFPDGPLIHQFYSFADFSIFETDKTVPTPFIRCFCDQLVSRLNLEHTLSTYRNGFSSDHRFEFVLEDGRLSIHDMILETFRPIFSFEIGMDIEDLVGVFMYDSDLLSLEGMEALEIDDQERFTPSPVLFYHEDITGQYSYLYEVSSHENFLKPLDHSLTISKGNEVSSSMPIDHHSHSHSSRFSVTTVESPLSSDFGSSFMFVKGVKTCLSYARDAVDDIFDAIQ